jgi:Holliday junction DNA helicase RuvB
MQGFIQRTPRGRTAMPAAYEKIGAPVPTLKPEDPQTKLF